MERAAADEDGKAEADEAGFEEWTLRWNVQRILQSAQVARYTLSATKLPMRVTNTSAGCVGAANSRDELFTLAVSKGLSTQ